MPGTSQLVLYNKALRHLGERRLASLSEAREPRRLLDDEYNDALNYCLGQGYWNHAMRTVSINHDTGVTPPFGLTYAFAKPSDWIRTHSVSADEFFTLPDLKYVDEAQYWYSNNDPIYVRFVSNDASYGLNLSIWPDTFTEYVAIYLARKISRHLTSSEELILSLKKDERSYRIDARSKDAMNEPTQFPPRGTWVRSRGNGLAANNPDWNGQTLV